MTALSQGDGTTCAILSDSTVRCWGDVAGESISCTAQEISGLTDVTAIASGDAACALLSNGTVQCWGNSNDFGELGNGTTTVSSTPVTVSGLSGVTAISTSSDFVCALLSGGTVWCWGHNSLGQLGSGTTSASSTTPVAVSGLSGVTAISAGLDSACALLSNGTVECWGNNIYGQLGSGDGVGPETCTLDSTGYPCSTTPVAVSGLSGVTSISVGGYFGCALLSGGTVQCWGYNRGFGELGDGTTNSTTIPVTVSGLSDVTAISAGLFNVCARLSGGTVDCWGSNYFGELGIGTSTGPETYNDQAGSTTPVALSGLSGVTEVSSNGWFACALLSSGAIDCWGLNDNCNLGIGTSTGPETCNGQPCSTAPAAVTW